MDELVQPKEFLENWLAKHQENFAQLKVKIWVTAKPIVYPKQHSASIDTESASKIGRLTLWNTGDAETEVYNLDSPEAEFLDSRVAISTEELLQLLDKFVARSV